MAREKFPREVPEIAYLPKAGTLILMKIPIAFFDNDEVPPLMGRLGFLETFDTEFLKSRTVVFKP